MKKIDIHIHTAITQQEGPVGNPYVPSYIGTAEEVRAHLEEQGISHALIMSAGEHGGYINCSNNAESAAIANASGGFYRWMCNLDAVDVDTVEERLSAYQKQGAVGVGEIMINDWLDSEFLQEVFRAAQKLGMPVLFHMSPEPGYGYGVCDRSGLPLLEQVLIRYPNLKVVGHSQVFWLEISGDCPKSGNAERSSMGRGPVTEGGAVIRLLDNYSNLYCDLSAYSGYCAMSRDEEFTQKFLTKYADRLMFATDTMNKHQTLPLEEMLTRWTDENRISTAAAEKIFHQNAERLFGF